MLKIQVHFKEHSYWKNTDSNNFKSYFSTNTIYLFKYFTTWKTYLQELFLHCYTVHINSVVLIRTLSASETERLILTAEAP